MYLKFQSPCVPVQSNKTSIKGHKHHRKVPIGFHQPVYSTLLHKQKQIKSHKNNLAGPVQNLGRRFTRKHASGKEENAAGQDK